MSRYARAAASSASAKADACASLRPRASRRSTRRGDRARARRRLLAAARRRRLVGRDLARGRESRSRACARQLRLSWSTGRPTFAERFAGQPLKTIALCLWRTKRARRGDDRRARDRGRRRLRPVGRLARRDRSARGRRFSPSTSSRTSAKRRWRNACGAGPANRCRPFCARPPRLAPVAIALMREAGEIPERRGCARRAHQGAAAPPDRAGADRARHFQRRRRRMGARSTRRSC